MRNFDRRSSGSHWENLRCLGCNISPLQIKIAFLLKYRSNAVKSVEESLIDGVYSSRLRRAEGGPLTRQRRARAQISQHLLRRQARRTRQRRWCRSKETAPNTPPTIVKGSGAGRRTAAGTAQGGGGFPSPASKAAAARDRPAPDQSGARRAGAETLFSSQRRRPATQDPEQRRWRPHCSAGSSFL